MAEQTANKISLRVAAKINWSLAVTGLREDGYHNIRSVFQNISLYDELTVSFAEQDGCLCSPQLPCKEEDNLALRAWLLLKKKMQLQEFLQIKISKGIPYGAGLGGGSADAAAVLIAANELLNLSLSQAELSELATPLGADIPFFFSGGLALVEGKGEIITPQELAPRLTLLIAKPQPSVSTAEVFWKYGRMGTPVMPDIDAVLAALQREDYATLAITMGNMLEPAAIATCPEIAEVKSVMMSMGCLPFMSGSGSAVLAICAEEDMPANIRQLHKHGFWAREVKTLDHSIEAAK